MKLFQDLINKVIMEHPSVTMTAVAFIVVVECLRYYLLHSGPIRNTGSRPSLLAKVLKYKQEGPLKGIYKESWYILRGSEDGSREAVTKNEFAIPGTEETNNYNCWPWAINPINGVLTLSHPSDEVGQPVNIDMMTNATREYLNVMKKRSRIKEYLETQDHEEVKEFMRRDDIQEKYKLIMGLRVIWDAPPFPDGYDYHYIRWYFGQWTAKCGHTGVLVKSVDDETYDIETEATWVATMRRSNEPGSVYLRWDTDKKIHREVIHKGPTIYYLIIIKRPFSWLLSLIESVSAFASYLIRTIKKLIFFYIFR